MPDIIFYDLTFNDDLPPQMCPSLSHLHLCDKVRHVKIETVRVKVSKAIPVTGRGGL
jgi:hypothetical protein